MASVFTEHVRRFGSASDPAGLVLDELGRLLRQRMRRRNLLTAPPSYLGCGGPAWDDETFDELLVDCYSFAILERLRALQNQLRARDNIDGLVVRNVDNFLLERQRRQDPVGYAVFGNVEAAVRMALAAGELDVEDLPQGRLNSQSVLRLARGPAPAPEDGADLVRRVFEDAPGWAEALPRLVVTAEEGQAWLRDLLRRLAAAGVREVRCGDLVSLVAGRARADWAARHAPPAGELGYEGEEELGQVVRLIAPDTAAEERDRWEQLQRDVLRQIDGLDNQPRKREALARVFTALVELIEAGGPDFAYQAELVRRLGVPRATLSDHFRSLKEVLQRVRGPD